MTATAAPPSQRTSSTTPLLVALLITVFVVPISIAGTAVALPSIARDLGSDPTPLQWVVNGFNAAFAVFTLVWGVLGDRIGYKVTFVLGTVIMIVASVASALAPSLLFLDAARVLAGVAAAGIFTSATSIISNAFPAGARARAFGLLGTVLGLGLAFGPVISGALTALAGWRGVFVAFAVAVTVSLLLSRAIPHITHGHVAGRKLVDFRLLRNPHFLAVSLVPVVQAIGFISMLTYLPVALSGVWGLNAGASGAAMLVMTVPILFLPALAVRAIARWRGVTVMGVIYLALGAMIAGDALLLLTGPATPLWVIFIPMVLLGISMGLPLGFIDGEALSTVPAHSSGTAAGVFNFLRLGAEAVSVGAYAAVLAVIIRHLVADPATAERVASGAPGHGAAYAEAFRLVDLGILALIVAGSIVIGLLHRAKTSNDRAAGERESVLAAGA
jgi:MFS family permease